MQYWVHYLKMSSSEPDGRPGSHKVYVWGTGGTTHSTVDHTFAPLGTQNDNFNTVKIFTHTHTHTHHQHIVKLLTQICRVHIAHDVHKKNMN